jgi:hypothetical protein
LDDTNVSDEGIEVLASLPKLALLTMNGSLVEGTGFERFGPQHPLDNLYLERTPASDEGVRVITRRLPRLRLLSLNRTHVTDRALEYLAGLKNLEDLRLESTQVSDEGVRRLIKHPTLMSLYVGDTRVSDGMVADLKKKNCRMGVYQ